MRMHKNNKALHYKKGFLLTIFMCLTLCSLHTSTPDVIAEKLDLYYEEGESEPSAFLLFASPAMHSARDTLAIKAFSCGEEKCWNK